MTLTITGHAQKEAWERRTMPPVEEVRPGLWSIPVPVPGNPIRYTLCYLFAATGRRLLVDPGWESAEGRDALAKGLAAAGLEIRDVTDVVITHVHADHHGLSRWVREHSGATIAMHPAEAATLPSRTPDWKRDATATMRDQGVPAGRTDALRMVDEEARHWSGLLVEPDMALEDGGLIDLGDWRLEAILTPGHTLGHLCLVERRAGLLLTGDHVLPRISSHVGEQPDPDAGVLQTYLDSLHRLLPYAGAEVLPAHEYRFRGLDRRHAELVEHHEERCAEIRSALSAARTPQTTWEMARRVTWSRGWESLSGYPLRLALAETSAHLELLARRGEVTKHGSAPRLWTVTTGLP